MKTKLLLIILSVLFGIGLIFIALKKLIQWETCPKYHQDYYNWFPYTNHDTLVFENNDKIKKFNIQELVANHRNGYMSSTKCGCCEEGLKFWIADNRYSYYFNIQNLNNENTCYGFEFYINKKHYNNVVFIDSLKVAEFKLVKGKGIVEINQNDSVWQLQKIIKSNQKIVFIEE